MEGILRPTMAYLGGVSLRVTRLHRPALGDVVDEGRGEQHADQRPLTEPDTQFDAVDGDDENSTMAKGTNCTIDLVMCRSTQVLVVTSCSTHVR
jgi:hypothetical protein